MTSLALSFNVILYSSHLCLLLVSRMPFTSSHLLHFDSWLWLFQVLFSHILEGSLTSLSVLVSCYMSLVLFSLITAFTVMLIISMILCLIFCTTSIFLSVYSTLCSMRTRKIDLFAYHQCLGCFLSCSRCSVRIW